MGKMVCRVRDHVIHHEGTTALPQDRHQRLACPWDGYVGNCLALHGDYEPNTTDLTGVRPKEIICQWDTSCCPVGSPQPYGSVAFAHQLSKPVLKQRPRQPWTCQMYIPFRLWRPGGWCLWLVSRQPGFLLWLREVFEGQIPDRRDLHEGACLRLPRCTGYHTGAKLSVRGVTLERMRIITQSSV